MVFDVKTIPIECYCIGIYYLCLYRKKNYSHEMIWHITNQLMLYEQEKKTFEYSYDDMIEWINWNPSHLITSFFSIVVINI